jgi:hypothetical protein
MTTPQIKDLSKEAPRSPRELIAGFVILARAIDKCRATLHGNVGAYHYDCPLDNWLFGFKGVTGEQFKAVVASGASDEELGQWLLNNGTPKTAEEIKAFSDDFVAKMPYNSPDRKEWFIEQCKPLNLDPAKTTLFDWLDADDKASFPAK